MSGCSGCKGTKTKKTVTKATEPIQPLIVEKSKDPKVTVKLQYYGGGMRRKKSGAGCSACGGGGKYALVTSERITFASDDAKKGIFSQDFSVGRTYFVTQKQADYLLSLTFTNPAGQTAHKFKVVE